MGELTVEEKTNEITAVLELLDLIDVKGDIVTAHAMNCQKKIVEKLCFNKIDMKKLQKFSFQYNS